MIDICSFHDDFYKEIADRASSSRIQKFIISSLDLHVDQSASCCLGKFLGLLPHMTHLEICSCSFHGDFYKEIADQASSSQIQTVNLDFSGNHYLPEQSQSAFKQLAKFLYSLPCLTTLEIKDNVCLPDDFFTELASLAASSQVIRKVSAQAVETCMDVEAPLLLFTNFHTVVKLAK
ncbi:uncharacterized protein LOC115925269 [Strongylocentrotus purpuratus]|uniref:Uncharacterized protein n=1 Tax=Strongylocentrotus purpuratus TaxID=7668 RepID=A0A7M7P1D3_STRPU|nr:uncharacterized protein LOC115925269 [Strongylocentrotus purpuratus]